MADLTIHTNITDDMSDTSRHNDIENPAPMNIIMDETEEICAQICAICLEPYIGGKDKVSWSKYQTCVHAFHKKCIESWLAETKNDDGYCPCCRGPYLKETVPNAEKVEGEAEQQTIEQMRDEDGAHDVGHASRSELGADIEGGLNMNINGNAKTPDDIEESNVQDKNPNNAQATIGSDYASFCIIHGLEKSCKKKNKQSKKCVSWGSVEPNVDD